ncbi:MAG: PKD-like domain-containing protein, partial [Bacteroidales bacterium]
MKKLTLFLFLMLLFAVTAQSQQNQNLTQIVCAGSTKNYNVTSTLSGSSYAWIITPSSGGTISGQGTNNINISWGNTSGTYIVQVIETSADGCPGDPITVAVTVVLPPTAIISYASPFCETASPQTVTLTGTGAYTGGVYSSTTGLTINTTTGLITPGTSTSGTYTVNYTIAASGDCPEVVATTNVTITSPPTASITYTGSPWCT